MNVRGQTVAGTLEANELKPPFVDPTQARTRYAFEFLNRSIVMITDRYMTGTPVAFSSRVCCGDFSLR
jgi:hypothetical protein